jgi:pimeloyl-ACP methyl ester carboxylesterase
MNIRYLFALATTLLAISACAAPVGVKRVDPITVQRNLTASAVSASRPTSFSRNVLREQDLFELFLDDPEAALAQLHDIAVTQQRGTWRELFALAELSFLYADESGKRPYFFAAAIYAWAYLFPEDGSAPPGPFDARVRVAADVYNRALTRAFQSEDTTDVELRGGEMKLPFGTLSVDFDPASLRWLDRQLTQLVPVAELEVTGLPTRYRRSGIGAPLAASTEPLPSVERSTDFVDPNLKVSVTALLRIDEARTNLASGKLSARLELYNSFDADTVAIDGREIPLELESTAALAYQLAESRVWEREFGSFFKNLFRLEQTQLYSTTPYRPGLIPVIFVHGTASSTGRWGEMFNQLSNDMRISGRVQFWFFQYDTGNPIWYSASLLRDSLTQAIRKLDPEGKDAALRRMVLIGHSQGGLLAKMTAINAANRFYDLRFRKPIDELDVSRDAREMIRRETAFEPLPFVERVVFIATPHRGSYLTVNRIARWVAGFITLPLQLVTFYGEIIVRNKDALVNPLASIGTSLDSMNPNNAWIRTLAAIPLVPSVRAHSIIAVQGNGPVADGEDGVVKYQSAHIDGVESELVVRSGHSVQANPAAINEVRRILLLHLSAPSVDRDSLINSTASK